MLFSCALLYVHFDLSFSREDGAVASLCWLVFCRCLVLTTPQRARRRWCRGHVPEELVDAMAIFSIYIPKCIKKGTRTFSAISQCVGSRCERLLRGVVRGGTARAPERTSASKPVQVTRASRAPRSPNLAPGGAPARARRVADRANVFRVNARSPR